LELFDELLDSCDDDGNGKEGEGDGDGDGDGDDEGGGDVFGTEGSNFVVHTYSSLLLISSNNISLSTVLS
jgi:hypothetical protein